MYVYEKMSKNIVTVKPDWSVSKAYQLMTELRHSRLPVVDNDNKLVGLITEKLLEEVNPSKATSLNVYEINYLLSKTKVRDIMRTGVFKINKNAIIEDAALIMKENKIGCLPVLDEDSTVVGIITRADVFRAFIDIYGIKAAGTRIEIKLDAEKSISQILDIVSKSNSDVLNINKFKSEQACEVVIKLADTECAGLLDELKNKGYNIVSVTKQH